MLINPTFVEVPIFAETGEKVSPSVTVLEDGYLTGELLPAQHLNWLFNVVSEATSETQEYIDNITRELNGVLTDAGLTPNSSVTQVNEALDILYARNFFTIDTSQTLGVIGTYTVTADIDVSLPEEPAIGTTYSIYAKSPCEVFQSSAEGWISYLDYSRTTKGVSGKLVLLAGEHVEITYVGEELNYALIGSEISVPLFTALPSAAYNATFTPDGKYLITGSNVGGSLAVYERSGDTFSFLKAPTPTPATTVRSIEVSSDGVYVSVSLGTDTTSTVAIYEVNDGDFTYVKTLSMAGTTPAYSVFSEDNQYLAVVTNGSPYLFVFKVDGGLFTPLAAVTPVSASPYSIAWLSSDMIVVGHSAAPYLNIYTRTGDVITKQADPATMGAAVMLVVPIHSLSRLLVRTSSALLKMLVRSGSTLAIDTGYTSLNSVAQNALTLTPDNSRIVLCMASSSLLSSYRIDRGAFELDLTIASSTSGGVYSVSRPQDGAFYAIGVGSTNPTNSPLIRVFSTPVQSLESWRIMSFDSQSQSQFLVDRMI